MIVYIFMFRKTILRACPGAPTSSIVRRATDSDNWPITWADDDNLYTAYGDGRGFDPKVPTKLSLGFAKVQGPATGFTGINIRSPTGEQTGDGAAGKKASGMLKVNGILYMWVRNVDLNGNQSQLAWSSDHAVTWTWSSWKFYGVRLYHLPQLRKKLCGGARRLCL